FLFNFFFFFILLCHPPCSSLFPYTTLFRSLYFYAMYFFLDNEPKLIVANPRLFLYGCLRWHLYILLSRDILHPLHLFQILLLISDRKSTRLNSSHVSISYAVFCL